jgi:hypothetical protein
MLLLGREMTRVSGDLSQLLKVYHRPTHYYNDPKALQDR